MTKQLNVPDLIRQGLHELDVRVSKGAAGSPGDAQKAEKRLADADRRHEHGARFVALNRIRAPSHSQARVVGEVWRPERVSSLGDPVKNSPQAGVLGFAQDARGARLGDHALTTVAPN